MRQSKHATQGRVKRWLIKKKEKVGISFSVVSPCKITAFVQLVKRLTRSAPYPSKTDHFDKKCISSFKFTNTLRNTRWDDAGQCAPTLNGTARGLLLLGVSCAGCSGTAGCVSRRNRFGTSRYFYPLSRCVPEHQ